MRRLLMTAVSVFGLVLFSGLGNSVVDGNGIQAQEVPGYEDLARVMLEVKEAQESFLDKLEGVTDPDVIGAECDSLGAVLEALIAPLDEALENHPELSAEVPEALKVVRDPCIEVLMEWDAYMNTTILPMANEMADVEALQSGFGRLNGAVFRMKYSRKMFSMGRGE